MRSSLRTHIASSANQRKTSTRQFLSNTLPPLSPYTHKHTAPIMSGARTYEEWQERWFPHFYKMDADSAIVNNLEIDLDNAIAEEKYSEAARLKAEIVALDNKDLFFALENEMNTAIEEERYEDAAKIRDATLMNLLGWWRGKFVTDAKASPSRILSFILSPTSQYKDVGQHVDIKFSKLAQIFTHFCPTGRVLR